MFCLLQLTLVSVLCKALVLVRLCVLLWTVLYARCLYIEFENVIDWATINRLKLNLIKTKELVFRRPRAQYSHLPPAVYDMEQVNCCKLLGVIFQSLLHWILMSRIFCPSVLNTCTFLSFYSIRVSPVNSWLYWCILCSHITACCVHISHSVCTLGLGRVFVGCTH